MSFDLSCLKQANICQESATVTELVPVLLSTVIVNWSAKKYNYISIAASMRHGLIIQGRTSFWQQSFFHILEHVKMDWESMHELSLSSTDLLFFSVVFRE